MSEERTPAQQEAFDLIPEELQGRLEDLVDDYRFAAIKHHGRDYVSYKVLAELVLAGWRLPEHDGQQQRNEAKEIQDHNASKDSE